MYRISSLVVAATVSLGAASAGAATVFSDDFTSYDTKTVLNAPDSLFAGVWKTTNGAVDYLRSGDAFGALCRGASACIDLDGSTSNAGDFSTIAAFAPGAYTLDFTLLGSSRGDTNTVTVSFGGYSESITVDSAGLATRSVSALVGAGGSSLLFSHAGGDNLGLLLTSVSIDRAVSAVPLPAAAPLLIAGLAALGGLGLRRRNTA